MPQYPFGIARVRVPRLLASPRSLARSRWSEPKNAFDTLAETTRHGTVDDRRRPPPRDSARPPLGGRERAASRPGEPLRVAADLRELPANAAMRLVLHDGNEYL